MPKKSITLKNYNRYVGLEGGYTKKLGRPSSAKRGYDHEWRKTRARFLSLNPLCELCIDGGLTRAATDVHHIIPKRSGGSDRENNLQALCKSCHSKITATGG